MAGKKRTDSKGRIFRDNEHQRKDGKYEYKYFVGGQRKTVYSWRLVPADRIPKGKRDDLSLREKEKAIEEDLADGINAVRASRMTLNELFRIYMNHKTKLEFAVDNDLIHKNPTKGCLEDYEGTRKREVLARRRVLFFFRGSSF